MYPNEKHPTFRSGDENYALTLPTVRKIIGIPQVPGRLKVVNNLHDRIVRHLDFGWRLVA